MDKTVDKGRVITLDEEGTYGSVSAKDLMLNVIEYIESRFKGPDNEDVLETGFPYLNFQNEDIVVLASKPSIGKTSFLLSLASNLILEKNIPVALISPTMSEGEIGMRLLSINSGVALGKIRSGMLVEKELIKIQDTAGKLFESPFYSYHEPNCDLKTIKTNAIKLAMEKHIQLLIVDDFEYLQDLVDAKDREYRRKLANLLCEVWDITLDLHIPVIISMNTPNSKSNLEPNLLDFKKYMVIPEEADKVIFLHRERNKTGFVKQDAKLIVAKNTCGPTGDMNVRFNASTGKFTCTDL